ncbi:class III poly(R)-hydroxyalkanoic acid synthase subunit PhaE [Egbenema bharatensis]|uniref:class III poly(R)-hydroxyalkanoic acid synthase subunit PhaE n=1 Tax=Egbenema bharatensis TaxID=3463334 RepID=UPI003A8460AC
MEETDFIGVTTPQLIKAWAEVSIATWKSWLDLIESAPSNSMAYDQAKSEPDPQSFTDYQQLQLRLLKLSFQAWQELLPKFESGEGWQQLLDHYVQELRTQIQAFSEEAQKTRQNTAELWQIYIQEQQKFNQIWGSTFGASIFGTSIFGASINPFSNLFSQNSTSSSNPWTELNHLYWNQIYEKTWGHFIQMPALGPNRVLHHKLMRSFDAWAQLYPASLNYQIVLAEVHIQSFEALMQALLSLAEQGETVREWAKFQQLWSQTADQIFDQAFCSEDNLRVRGKFLNAVNQYKLCQQELIETYMQMLNLPTRSEVDEVHKNIYDLRKEIKHLKQTLAQYESQVQIIPFEDAE